LDDLQKELDEKSQEAHAKEVEFKVIQICVYAYINMNIYIFAYIYRR
jgi:hypothetical protein